MDELQTPPRRKGLRSIARTFWRDHRLLVTCMAALAALVLGFVGFSLQETSWPVGARLYAAVELFHLYTDSTRPPNNIYLQVAQWLAPVTVGYVAFQLLAEVFAQQRTALRIRFMRDHVIICGLGRCGIRLARSFRNGADDRPGISVVVIDRNPNTADKGECANLGIPVLTGDARDVAMLRQAGLLHTRYLIAVCGNDAVDSEVASAALSLVRAAHNHTLLRCFIHVEDHQLSEQLEKLALEVPAEKGAPLSQFEWFNVYRQAPVALLNSDQELLHSKDGQSPHVIVIGSSLLGRNLVVETARRWSLGHHATSIRITLVAADAAAQCGTLKAQYTHLSYVCDLVPVSVDAAALSSANRLNIDLPSGHSRTKAFVCVADDDECLRATIQVREALPEDIQVVTCTTGSSGIATFLRNKTGILSRVQEFALLDIALTADVLLNTVKEHIAQALHADYLANRLQHPQPKDARGRAVVPWELLPESFRQANRAKASGIGLELSELGFRLVRNDSWRAPAFVFSPAQVVELAKQEHSRWMDQKKREGWRLGPKRDDGKKLNPYLVEWAELPKDIQEIDCDFARCLPTILASAGYSIVHKDGSPTKVESQPVTTSL
jgi:hypothetical protein